MSIITESSHGSCWYCSSYGLLWGSLITVSAPVKAVLVKTSHLVCFTQVTWCMMKSLGEYISIKRGWGGGGVQTFHFGKKDFELGVGGEGQDTSRPKSELKEIELSYCHHPPTFFNEFV